MKHVSTNKEPETPQRMTKILSLLLPPLVTRRAVTGKTFLMVFIDDSRDDSPFSLSFNYCYYNLVGFKLVCLALLLILA